MVSGAWLKSRLLRWSRRPYNSNRYRSSLRRSRFSSILFSDPAFLDIHARSALRLKKFRISSRVYRRATDLGWMLRDHHQNQFISEFNLGNWLEAYLVASSDISEAGKSRRDKVVAKISKLTESERVQIIQRISETLPVEEDLSDLLPWKTKRIELSEKRESFYLLSNEKLETDRYKRELFRTR